MMLAALLTLVLAGVVWVTVETFLDERCPENPSRARRVRRYGLDMSDDKSKPNDPDVMTEDDIMREGARLDEGAVDPSEDQRLREAARDRKPQDR